MALPYAELCSCMVPALAGMEIIEVNGAVFYRKRKASVVPLVATPGAKRQQEQQQQQEEVAVGCGEPQAVALECDVAMDPAPLPNAELAPERLSADPLTTLQSQLEACLPTSCPKAIAVQFALEQLLLQGAARLDHTSEQQDATTGGFYSQAAKRVLQGFSQLMQERIDAASALLLQVKPPSAEAAPPPAINAVPLALVLEEPEAVALDAAAAAPDCAPEAAPLPAAPLPAADSSLAVFLGLPPMIRDLSQSGSMLRGHLQRQLAALQREEATWVQLRAKSELESADEGGSVVVSREAAAPVENAEGGGAVPGGAASLETASAEAGAPSSGSTDGSWGSGQEGDPAPCAVKAGSSLKQTEEDVNLELGIQVREKNLLPHGVPVG